MNKLIDLHTHSNSSDGTLTPGELVKLAKSRNISALALTDHDTIAGLDEFLNACNKYDIEGVTGTEISTLHNKLTNLELHILGLNFPFPNDFLGKELKQFEKLREDRNLKMLDNFNKLGFSMTLEDLQGKNKATILTRAHFANVLLEKGYAKDRKEVFEKYLSKTSPAYVEKTMPSSKTVIDLIHKASGVAILAHPNLYGLNLDEVYVLCKELKELGLDGIEVSHSSYKKPQMYRITEIANKLGFVFSGGSDFHGDNKPMINLGSGKGNLAIPYTFLEEIKNANKYNH